MTKAAAGVITHEAYRRTSPLFWRHTTSLATAAGHYRHGIEAQTRRGIKQFVHTTRLPTASWTSGPTTKPAPPPTRRPQDLHNPSPTPAVTARTNSSQV